MSPAPAKRIPSSPVVPARTAGAGRTQGDRTAASREALITAAIDLLVEHGAHCVSVSAFCDRAGRSVGTHLHHFGTRSHLMCAVAEVVTERRIEHLKLTAVADGGAAGLVDGARAFYASRLGHVWVELWIESRHDDVLRAQMRTHEHNAGEAFLDLLPSGHLSAQQVHSTLLGDGLRLHLTGINHSAAMTMALRPFSDRTQERTTILITAEDDVESILFEVRRSLTQPE